MVSDETFHETEPRVLLCRRSYRGQLSWSCSCREQHDVHRVAFEHFLAPLTLMSSSTWPSLERVFFAFCVNSNKTYCSVSAGPHSSLMQWRTSCSTTTPPTAAALQMIQWLKLTLRLVWTKQHTSVQLQLFNLSSHAIKSQIFKEAKILAQW